MQFSAATGQLTLIISMMANKIVYHPLQILNPTTLYPGIDLQQQNSFRQK